MEVDKARVRMPARHQALDGVVVERGVGPEQVPQLVMRADVVSGKDVQTTKAAEKHVLRGLGRLHIFPGDDVGAHHKLGHLFGIDTPLDYAAVQRLVAPWYPYAGVVYFHLLLDSLSRAGLTAHA